MQPKETLLRRLGGGTFGSGTLGVCGLMSGFLVPLTVIVIRVARGPVIANPDPAGGLLLFLPDVIEVAMGLLLGLVQGVLGLIVGLVLGFAVGAVGRPDERPVRMRVALTVLTSAALGLAICFGLDITTLVPGGVPMGGMR